MKKLLFLSVFFLFSCQTMRHKTSPNSPRGFFSRSKEGNSSVPSGHPEGPFALTAETPAWEIALWIFGVIVVVCCAPAFCRFLCGVWPSFCERIRNGFKNLTKKKD